MPADKQSNALLIPAVWNFFSSSKARSMASSIFLRGTIRGAAQNKGFPAW